jgi:hypothetical protein
LLCNHRTGEKKIAAGAALMAIPFSGKQLALNIFFSKVNQYKTPQLSSSVKHEAGALERLP